MDENTTTTLIINHQVRLASRPVGLPTEANWQFSEEPVNDPAAGGVLVQVLALSVDPHRLYVERSLPSAFGAIAPVLYFDPRNAHLPNRPREIVEIWEARHDYPPEFSPAPSPTFAFPVLDFVPGGQATIRRFKILNTFRPWWASQIYLPRRARPVSLAGAAAVQLGLLGLGGIMLFRAQSSSARRRASG